MALPVAVAGAVSGASTRKAGAGRRLGGEGCQLYNDMRVCVKRFKYADTPGESDWRIQEMRSHPTIMFNTGRMDQLMYKLGLMVCRLV